MCIYPTEQACPELFVILSASGTVSFVNSNEMERKSILLTGYRSKGGRGEPITVEDPCLSAGVRRAGLLFRADSVQDAVSKSTN